MSTKTVAYHQNQQTVIEFSENHVFKAELPSGESFIKRSAVEVYMACLDNDNIQMRNIDT